MNAPARGSGDKKDTLKALIRQLHAGGDPQALKKKFKTLLASLSPEDVARVEEELIAEGMSREQVEQLCDVHLEVFREALEKDKPLLPPGHPLAILMAEHSALLEQASRLQQATEALFKHDTLGEVRQQMEVIRSAATTFRNSESHYLREENVLFPSLEKHGITEPPAIMWREHDRIRELKKQFYALLDEGQRDFASFRRRVNESAKAINQMLAEHFYKENNILFPTSLRVMSPQEWADARHQFDELGYGLFQPAPFTPPPAPSAPPGQPKKAETGAEGRIRLETGELGSAELEAVLNTLPVDITFVGADDTVRYFNQARDRIFPRTKAVLGRNVERCHPQKSLHVVRQIIDDFRQGKRDRADFWIRLQGRLVLIRYFPVRDAGGSYLGVLEVTQDITDIQKITGEKRLLTPSPE